MSQLASLDADDTEFRQSVIISITIHVSLLLIVSLKGFLLPSNIIEIPNSVRVDMVALPDKLPEDIRPSPPAANTPEQAQAKPPKEKPAPAPPEKPKPVSLSSVKDSQKKALEKLQAMAALEKIKNEVNADKQKTASAPPTPQYKGNIISSGNSFTGMSRLRVNEYLENLSLQVREHWVLPQWLSDAKLKAAVVISIDGRGYVVKKEIHTSSGNSIFDSSCLAAVTDSSPFPEPPSEVKDALIMIRFPFE